MNPHSCINSISFMERKVFFLCVCFWNIMEVLALHGIKVKQEKAIDAIGLSSF